MSVKDKMSEETFGVILHSAVKYQALLGVLFSNAKNNNCEIHFDDQAIEKFLKENEPDKYYYLITRSISHEKNC